MPTVAITRGVSPGIGACELGFLEREPIDVDRARAQHAAYESVLEGLGCRIFRLEAEAGLPDSVFVEDTAVVLDEVAIITRPGAASRRPETGAVAAVLGRYRPLLHIVAPATLDGGDVLRTGRRLYVGRTARSNEAGIAQLRELVRAYGYEVRPVAVRDCLHLKSAVSAVSASALLLDPTHVDPADFGDHEVLEIPDGESGAANALLLGESVLIPTGCPATRDMLAAMGMDVVEVDNRELAKAEGGLTCCSLIVATGEREHAV